MTRNDLIAMERASIRDFVLVHSRFFRGTVLDYGCGIPGKCVQPQPYRDIIEKAGAVYVPYDFGYKSAQGNFNTILCTQVMQYIPEPQITLKWFREHSNHLVMTYPTLWDEVEKEDLWRFTKLGMERFLKEAGFKIVVHQPRWTLPCGDLKLIGGYGVVASS